MIKQTNKLQKSDLQLLIEHYQVNKTLSVTFLKHPNQE